MAISNTSITNMALGKIGAKPIVNIDDTTDTNQGAIQARLHFEQTRDALIRSHWWRFARARATLSVSVDTPDFEWDYQYPLPNDFLAMRSIYEDRVSDENIDPYELEGKMLLTDETEMSIRYIKKVTDPTEFDPLFVEVFILKLGLKFISSLAGGSPKLQETLQNELRVIMPAVRALDRQETNTAGRDTWNDERYS